MPRQFLNLLGIEDIRKVELGQQVERKMTILFADIRDFTALPKTMSPQENFSFFNSCLVQMDPVITAHGGFIDKYIGDANMALREAQQVHQKNFDQALTYYHFVDTRSPAEFAEDHLSGAISMPALNDEERALSKSTCSTSRRAGASMSSSNWPCCRRK